MCTASWIHFQGGFTLLFNRDERRDRARGGKPGIIEFPGGKAVAPRDGKAGGTWIFANDAGCAGALLNHYPQYDADTDVVHDFISRGQLLLKCSRASTPDTLAETLRNTLDSGPFRPFLLAFFSPEKPPLLWTWDGTRLHPPSTPDPPVTTSSWKSSEVEAARRRAFENRFPTGQPASPDDLEAFHLGEDTPPGPYGVLMDRDDARTVSFTRIDVGPLHVQMTYRERLSGHRFEAPRRTVLPRRDSTTPSHLPGHRSHHNIRQCP